MRIGVVLPAFGTEGVGAVGPYARHAEECGLESVWKGDHLIAARPVLDSTLVLTAAATATERIRVGFGVLLPALRPVAWTAKQIASLQHLSGDRVLLGVGTGGAVHGAAGWRAAGVPYAERGARTDAALELLPGLIAGKPVTVEGEPVALARRHRAARAHWGWRQGGAAAGRPVRRRVVPRGRAAVGGGGGDAGARRAGGLVRQAGAGPDGGREHRDGGGARLLSTRRCGVSPTTERAIRAPWW
ncbi:luciferase-like monooxygenase [Prauserella shujinwangii]|uniref:Luciferase-like monooxygenase n=1 Tax=Prauserella shujinwangii TaxID=1453103 RepID=A0A2T0LYA1_9PSEU|nr:luciferase-like monooxygenase [Prauserella shujinwangii]